MSAPGLTRVAVWVLAVWTLVCVGDIVRRTVMNPMDARERALEARLSGTVTFADELPEPDQAPLKELRERIVNKKALWKELVGAPVSATKPVADPNLKEKLKGVSATRAQIERNGVVHVKMLIGPQDKRGTWKKVGETVNGLTIREITPEAVVFATKQGGKEYTVELPRR